MTKEQVVNRLRAIDGAVHQLNGDVNCGLRSYAGAKPEFVALEEERAKLTTYMRRKFKTAARKESRNAS